jgi:maltooligosyltrehalose trehalohydrolase
VVKLSWRPSFGAWCEAAGARFRVWAPTTECVDVVIERPRGESLRQRLERAPDGTHTGFVEAAGAGDCYRYRLDGEGPYPDPAARFQPNGVHGPSQIIDALGFSWSDDHWRGVSLQELVAYELHVGTFTPAGTFAGLTAQLPYLRGLGVTAIELMPVADFPGRWNWGYDGACLFAPARCYGTPDDLRRLVDHAHGLDLGVLLDVVYNHFGPDGAYAHVFSPYYLAKRHQTPWGDAVNLDGPHSDMVRAFLIENALHWLHEYHLDGLRLDATHALFDDSPRHFLAELAASVRDSVTGRKVLLIAEDQRNLAHMVRPQADGGWGFDAVWADDFHHQLRRHLAGDNEGYYRDYTGSVADLATTLRQGWFYCGQHSLHLGGPRGTDPKRLAPPQFVISLQNHDQVGNRALGERVHHQIDLAAFRAATVLLLCAPETPLLFMGQEWAASAPFLYFTDHQPELGRLVTEGRRREFAAFSAFTDATARARIPDPQAPTTFQTSRLDWSESITEPHASILRLYRAVLALRRSEPGLRSASWSGFEVSPVGAAGLVLRRRAAASLLVVAVQLSGAGALPLMQGGTAAGLELDPARTWKPLLTTEDIAFSPHRKAIRLELFNAVPTAHFERPGAVILSVPMRQNHEDVGEKRRAL